MTLINNSAIIDSVERGSSIPSVVLTYNPPVVLPGGQVQVSLEVDGKFAPNTVLTVDLTSENEEVLLSAPIVFPGLTTDLTIPRDFAEGTYRLQVIYKNSVLDSTFLDVVEDKAYVQQMEDFAKGLSIEDQVSDAVEKGNYEQAFTLQEQVERFYRSANNLELAARSWEDLGEALFAKEQPELSKQALVKALTIYSDTKGLNNKEKTIDRINQAMKICEAFILSSRSKNLGEEKSKSKTTTKVSSLKEQPEPPKQASINALIIYPNTKREEESKSKTTTKVSSLIEQARKSNDEVLDKQILAYKRRLQSLAQKIKTNPLSPKESREFKNIKDQLAQLLAVKKERQRSKNSYTKNPYS